MSADTTVPLDIDVEVSVEAKQARPKRGRRLMDSLRRAKDRVITAVRKATVWTRERAHNGRVRSGRFIRACGRGVKTTATRTFGWLKHGAWSIGHRLYWSGAAVGRGIGRVMRFFGRSAWTSFVATTRFLRFILSRGTGWALRAFSFVFKTVLQGAFQVTAVAFLLTALLLWVLARTTDGYSTHIHDRAVAMSRGETHSKTQHTEHAAREQKVKGELIDGKTWDQLDPNVQAAAMKALKDEHQLTVTVDKVGLRPEKPRMDQYKLEPDYLELKNKGKQFLEDDWNPYLRWNKPQVDLGIPNDLRTEEIELEAIGLLAAMPELESFHEWREEHEQSLSDNEFFQRMSYWKAREGAVDLFYDAMQDMEGRFDYRNGTFEQFIKDLKVHYNGRKAVLLKNMKPEFDNRNLHRNSVVAALGDHLKYVQDRLHREWDLGLYKDRGPKDAEPWTPTPDDTKSYRTPRERGATTAARELQDA